MDDALKEALFDEVVKYFQERVSDLGDELEKTIEAGDAIADDVERAKIIIEAVCVALARRERTKTAMSSGTKATVSGRTSEPRFRGVLAQATYENLQKIEGEFTAKKVVEQMRSAGYQFASHPDISVNEVLQKFLGEGWIEVTEQGAGRRPTFYRRVKKSRTKNRAKTTVLGRAVLR
jgi:hypothetical protein